MHLRNSHTLLLAGCLLLSARLWTQGSGQAPTAAPETQAPVASPSTSPIPHAQEPQAPSKEDEGFTFRTQVQEVVVHATVIDKNKRLVTNLDRSAFKVFEDDKPQTITSFRHEDIPVAQWLELSERWWRFPLLHWAGLCRRIPRQATPEHRYSCAFPDIGLGTPASAELKLIG
jgi:hypothetical protein